MPATILVPLDGSPLAARALPFARRLAQSTGARLQLVHALPFLDLVHLTDPQAMRLSQQRAAEDALAAKVALVAAAARLREGGIDAEATVHRGEAAQVIVDDAHARDADLIVMSTHGWGGLQRWLYGSVADQVLRQSDVPVLLIPGTCVSEWPEGRAGPVLVALDGSPFAEEAVETAGVLARALSADLVLLEVVPRRRRSPRTGNEAPGALNPMDDTDEGSQTEAAAYLERLAGPLRAKGGVVQTRAANSAYPPTAITTVARETGAALIAMTTHGRSGLARLVLGSVATATLQLAEVPLLLVRPAALRRARAARAATPHEVQGTGRPIRLSLTPDELRILQGGLEAPQATEPAAHAASVATAARRRHARLSLAGSTGARNATPA